MNLRVIEIVAIVLVIVVAGGVWYRNSQSNKGQATGDRAQATTETVDFCGVKYQAQILILKGADVVKTISSLANTEDSYKSICSNVQLNIRDSDVIGVATKKEVDDTYLVALYRLNDPKRAREPFGQSVLIFKFDFDKNRAYFQRQFDGSFVRIGAIREEAEINTSIWKTYRNEEYGFEFKYPVQWTVREYGSVGKTPFVDIEFPPREGEGIKRVSLMVFPWESSSTFEREFEYLKKRRPGVVEQSADTAIIQDDDNNQRLCYLTNFRRVTYCFEKTMYVDDAMYRLIRSSFKIMP